jgi:hypothetical protein
MSVSLQKANFWKRFSAWLVDTVLVILLAVACSLPLLTIMGFDENGQQLIGECYRICDGTLTQICHENESIAL